MANVPPERAVEEMRKYKGRQYLLEGEWAPGPDRVPRLYTVVRQHRFSREETVNTGLYFIIDGAICQAPNLLSVLQARYVSSFFFSKYFLSFLQMNSLYHIHKAFTNLSKLTEFDIANGYVPNPKYPGTRIILRSKKKKKKQSFLPLSFSLRFFFLSFPIKSYKVSFSDFCLLILFYLLFGSCFSFLTIIEQRKEIDPEEEAKWVGKADINHLNYFLTEFSKKVT